MKKKDGKTRKNSPSREIFRRFKKNKPAMIGAVIFIMITLVAVFADVIVPYEKALETNPREALQAPSAAHIFGTDQTGRDVFARIVHGSRPSLLIGIAATLITSVGGVLLGGIVGYYGGKVDYFVMRFLEVVQCVPQILLMLVLITALEPGTINLLLVMIISALPGTARMVRAIVLGLSDSDYIQSAKSYGRSEFSIIVKHLIPNAMGNIIVNTTGMLSGMIMGIAGVSFLGFGVQPPMPEWGIMVAESRSLLRTSTYLSMIPGLTIVITALSVNLMGDGLRDALDPRLKN